MWAGPPVTIPMFPPDRPQSCRTASVPAKGFIPDPHWHRMAERGRAGKARHTQISDTKKNTMRQRQRQGGFKVMGLTWLTKGPTLTIPRLWLELVLLESNEEMA